MKLSLVLRLIAVALGAALFAGCEPNRLNEQSVRKFVDAADQAFLSGQSNRICDTRASTFELIATDFEPAGERLVANWQEAKEIAAQREAAGERIAGKTVKLGHREYCAMAFSARDFFKRATMERGELKIVIRPDGRRATVKAHYTVREPVYEYGESAVSYQDQVERQIATRQTESEDESIVILDDNNETKFLSTRSISQSFRVAPERDRRL